MNSDNVVGIDRQTGARETGAASAEVDATLRLIASLPAPEGLEDRVHAALRTGHFPARGSARVIELPVRGKTDGSWNTPFLRGAAAAAIAFAVVGGGWGVYSRVQTAKVIAMPSQVQQHGFSNAGAKHETLNGPTISTPQAGAPQSGHSQNAHSAQTGAAAAVKAPHLVEIPPRQGQTPSNANGASTPTATPQ